MRTAGEFCCMTSRADSPSWSATQRALTSGVRLRGGAGGVWVKQWPGVARGRCLRVQVPVDDQDGIAERVVERPREALRQLLLHARKVVASAVRVVEERAK